jgi:hypothetical protein
MPFYRPVHTGPLAEPEILFLCRCLTFATGSMMEQASGFYPDRPELTANIRKSRAMTAIT